MTTFSDAGLETKFLRFAGEASVGADGLIEGYASLFGAADQGGDIVEQGAYARSLKEGRRIKMLWQHDPREPIGTWDEVREDERGLYVKGPPLAERGARTGGGGPDRGGGDRRVEHRVSHGAGHEERQGPEAFVRSWSFGKCRW
jgi:hypothetical protein